MSTPTQGGPGDDLPPYRSGGPPGWVQPPAYGPTGQPAPRSAPGRPDGPYEAPYDPAAPYEPADRYGAAPAHDPAYDPQRYDPAYDPQQNRQYPDHDGPFPAYDAPHQQADQPYRRPRDPAPAGGLSKGARSALVAAGLVAVAAASSLVGWTLAGGGDTPAPAASSPQTSGPAVPAEPSESPSSTASRSPSTRASAPVTGAAAADPAAAKAELRTGGVSVPGVAEQAWTWNDTNGRNILVLSKQVMKREGDAIRDATLFATFAAGREGSYDRLRRLTQPGTKDCDVDFGLDFVPGSVVIGDADSDGYAEATVGWWFSCRGDPGPYNLRLALLNKTEYWILRGEGQRASDPALPNGIIIPPATFKPSEPASAWPKGSYDSTVTLFKTLFK